MIVSENALTVALLGFIVLSFWTTRSFYVAWREDDLTQITLWTIAQIALTAFLVVAIITLACGVWTIQ